MRARARDRPRRSRGRGARRHGGELLNEALLFSPAAGSAVGLSSRWVVVLIILAIVVAIGGGLMTGMLQSYFAARDITSSDAQAAWGSSA